MRGGRGRPQQKSQSRRGEGREGRIAQEKEEGACVGCVGVVHAERVRQGVGSGTAGEWRGCGMASGLPLGKSERGQGEKRKKIHLCWIGG